MLLYLVRHGIALDVDGRKVTCDEMRPLSSMGRERTARAARGLKRVAALPDLVLTSPLVRARETAEIFAANAGGKGTRVEEWDQLATGVPAERTAAGLR